MNTIFSFRILKKFYEPTFRGISRVIKDAESDPTKPKVVSRKAREHEERITLLGPDNSVSIMELSSAHNLSVRRQLKLVKIEDTNVKTRRPVYKLMANSEYHDMEVQNRKEKKEERSSMRKGDKLVTVSTRIGEHDLMTRIKNIIKWLQKKHQIRIVITGEQDVNLHDSEKIYKTVETNVKTHGKIVQKRTKGNSLRFEIVPDEIYTDDKETQSKSSSTPSPDNPISEKGPL